MRKFIFLAVMCGLFLVSLFSLVLLYRDDSEASISLDESKLLSLEQESLESCTVEKGNICKKQEINAELVINPEKILVFEGVGTKAGLPEIKVRPGEVVKKGTEMYSIGEKLVTSKSAGRVLRTQSAENRITIEVLPYSALRIKALLPAELLSMTDGGPSIKALYKDRELALTIEQLAIEEGTGGVEVIYKPGEVLEELPGYQLILEAVYEQKDNALLLPTTAIVWGEKSCRASIKTNGGTEYVAVELGIEADGYVEITAGLKEGDEVVYPEETLSLAYHLRRQ